MEGQAAQRVRQGRSESLPTRPRHAGTGWPDLWVGSKIWSGWVELKAHDGELSTAQRIVGRKLTALGIFVVARASADWKTMLLETVEGDKMPESMACGILDARRMLELMA